MGQTTRHVLSSLRSPGAFALLVIFMTSEDTRLRDTTDRYPQLAISAESVLAALHSGFTAVRGTSKLQLGTSD